MAAYMVTLTHASGTPKKECVKTLIVPSATTESAARKLALAASPYVNAVITDVKLLRAPLLFMSFMRDVPREKESKR